MKVMCIDASSPSGLGRLKEGVVYTVSQCPVYKDNYDVKELPLGENGYPISYGKFRFIPLSDIDETELASVREQDKIYH
jgi:hypothetical protein